MMSRSWSATSSSRAVRYPRRSLISDFKTPLPGDPKDGEIVSENTLGTIARRDQSFSMSGSWFLSVVARFRTSERERKDGENLEGRSVIAAAEKRGEIEASFS